MRTVNNQKKEEIVSDTFAIYADERCLRSYIILIIELKTIIFVSQVLLEAVGELEFVERIQVGNEKRNVDEDLKRSLS